MQSIIKNKYCIIICLLILFIFMCDSTRMKLANGAYLEQNTDGDEIYFIYNGRFNNDQGGVFEGIVTSLAVKENLIVAKVKKQYRGDVDGWYTYDFMKEIVDGPYSSLDLLPITLKEEDLVKPQSFFK